MKRLGRYLVYSFAMLGGLGVLLLLAYPLYADRLLSALLNWSLASGSVELRHGVLRVSGWQGLDFTDLGLSWKSQQLQLERLRLDGRSLSLEGLEVTLDLEKLPTAPEAPLTETAGASPEVVPFDSFSGLERCSLQMGLRLGAEGAVFPLSLNLRPEAASQQLVGTWQLGPSPLTGKGQLALLLDGSVGHLSMEEGGLDLAALRTQLGPLWPSAAASLQSKGELQLSGQASWSTEEVRAGLNLSFKDLNLSDETMGWSAEALSGRLELGNLTELATQGVQSLHARSLRYGEDLAQDLWLVYEVSGLHSLKIHGLEARCYGGRVWLEPVTLDPTGEHFPLVVAFEGLELESLMALFPNAEVSASGRVDGRVEITVGPSGPVFGKGWVRLNSTSPATLAFHQPGMLTAGMSPRDPSYATMKTLEEGLQTLTLRVLQVDLLGGNPQGLERSALIRIEGHPKDEKVKAPLELDININGPIAPLLRWGMDSRVQFQ